MLTIKCDRKNTNSIVKVLFLYWFALVIWQNIGSNDNKSGIDMIIKIGILFVLFIYYIFHSNGKLSNAHYIFPFLCCLAITFLTEIQFSPSIIVYYGFVGLIIFLVFGIGNRFKISFDNYKWFLNAVICVTVYCAIYAILFYTDQFTTAFSISTAYGHELTSFFSSSHEYGMYMSAGIISCLFILEDIKKGKLKYIIALCILIPNLILTYSRTSIFSLAIFMFFYILLGTNRGMKKTLVFLVVIGMSIFLLSDKLQSFFFNIVNKDGNLAGRDTLTEVSLSYFKNSSLFKQIFGNGITASRNYMERMTTHPSVHNAYLQVLLYFGYSGIVWFIGYLIAMIKGKFNLYKKNKIWGNRFLCLGIWCMSMMIANTHLIFTSPIDCYFLTIFAIVIPKYVTNYIKVNKR